MSRDAGELKRVLVEEGVAGRIKQWVGGLVDLVDAYWKDVIIPLAKLDAGLESYKGSEEYRVIAEHAGGKLEDLIDKFSSLRRDLFYAFQHLVEELLVGKEGGGLSLLSQALGVDIKVVEEIAGMRGYPKAEAPRSTVDTEHVLGAIVVAIDALYDSVDIAERIIAVAGEIEGEITGRGIEGLWDDRRLGLFHDDLIFLADDITDTLHDIYGVIDDAQRVMAGEGSE